MIDHSTTPDNATFGIWNDHFTTAAKTAANLSLHNHYTFPIDSLGGNQNKYRSSFEIVDWSRIGGLILFVTVDSLFTNISNRFSDVLYKKVSF